MLTLSWPDADGSRLLSAAYVRHSRRSFDGREVGDAELDTLEEAAERARPLPGVRVAVARVMPADVFKGVIGAYGRIEGAPSGLVMVGPVRGARAPVAVGYAGEAVVLEATALGLDTCWVAGMFDKGVARNTAEVGPEERVYAVSPLGHATASLSKAEKSLYRSKPGVAKGRTSVGEIAVGIEGWPAWAREGVEAARVAPSAYNRQPWRFRLDGDAVTVAFAGLDTPITSKRLDCGIAMLHFEAAVRAAGGRGGWTLMDHRSGIARYTLHP